MYGSNKEKNIQNGKKYSHNKSDQNYTQYNTAKINSVITELRRSKYNYAKDLAAKIKTGNKLFWSYICSKMKTQSNLGQFKFELPDGSYTKDNQEKAEILNSYLASVFAVEGPEALPEFEDRNFAEPETDIDINGLRSQKQLINSRYKNLETG